MILQLELSRECRNAPATIELKSGTGNSPEMCARVMFLILSMLDEESKEIFVDEFTQQLFMEKAMEQMLPLKFETMVKKDFNSDSDDLDLHSN